MLCYYLHGNQIQLSQNNWGTYIKKYCKQLHSTYLCCIVTKRSITVQELPYMQYPAATMFLPACNTDFKLPSLSFLSMYIPKIYKKSTHFYKCLFFHHFQQNKWNHAYVLMLVKEATITNLPLVSKEAV